MLSLFRVHHKTSIHQGMYQGDNAPSCVRDMHETEFGGRHPPPWNDDKIKETFSSFSDWYFGFNSIEQLKFWIYQKEWREQLHEAGFVVTQIKAKSIVHGDTQAIFNILDAYTIVEELSLLEI